MAETVPNVITNDRLRGIAETAFDDFEDLCCAVRELALAVYERSMHDPEYKPFSTRPGAQRNPKRMSGKPLGDMISFQCRACHKDVVAFQSKTGKPYICDVEMGEYKNVRTALSAPNWFHKCGAN